MKRTKSKTAKEGNETVLKKRELKRKAKLQAADDSQLSKAAIWQKYHYVKGEILDMRAVLR